jgi:Class II flagellar assembly regulator
LRRSDERRPAQGAVPSLSTVGGIDALVALQGFDDPAERRRRAVGKGRAVLDEIKLGGALNHSNLNRMLLAAEQLKDRRAGPRHRAVGNRAEGRGRARKMPPGACWPKARRASCSAS